MMSQETAIQTQHRWTSSCCRVFCGWCGRGEGAGLADCKVDQAMRDAIIHYKKTVCRSWRRDLIEAWNQNPDLLGFHLSRALNQIGPNGIRRIPNQFLEDGK